MLSSVEPLQADFAIVLHPCEVNAHRHREIIEEIHHFTGITVSLAVEVVAAEVQIDCGFHNQQLSALRQFLSR